MKTTQTKSELPSQVLQLIEEDENARGIIKKVLEEGTAVISEEQEEYLTHLEGLGIISMSFYPANRKDTFYEVKFQKEYSGLKDALSNAIIYAQADGERTEILNEYLGESVILNGLEGMLIPKQGSVFYITRFIGQDIRVSDGAVIPIERIMEAEIPILALQRDGDKLSSGETIVSYSCYGKEKARYTTLDLLLTKKGVTKVGGNLFHGLL